MGIRGLTDAVRAYGTPAALDHGSVVIDGPALVHKVLNGCLLLAPRRKTYLCQPSYTQLGETTIAWLDKLKSHDITVRKIYFDGFLPKSKWDVRIERLISQTNKLNRLCSQEAPGILVPPDDVFASVVADISITRAGDHTLNGSLPYPAFLVSAVIDALRQHAYWGKLVQLVPGEADDFCIADIQQNSGTVLTGDSDLLVQDLGVDGFVCFFSDLTESQRDGQSNLQGLMFNYQTLNRKLGLEQLGGLLRVAFEMEQRSAPLGAAIKFANKAVDSPYDSPKYAAFTREHSPRTHISPDHPVLGAILTLDPRISELVVQSQLLQDHDMTPVSRAARGHHRLSMFLPIMIEDASKKSSWAMSEKIRALAYSLVQTASPCSSQPVVEYRFLSSGRNQGGREVEVLDETRTAEGCSEICSTLTALSQDSALKKDLWLSFALWLEMQWMASQYDSPASILLLERAKRSKGTLQRYPWHVIHFAAQINATLYSLRMLQQVIRAIKVLLPDTHGKDNDDLSKWLVELPSIELWPTVDTVLPKLMGLGSVGLSRIAKMLGIPDKAPAKPTTADTKKRKKSSSSKTASSRDTASQPRSNNLFELLGRRAKEDE